ncbi:hypothetical protein [Paenibacillus protaetiae]|nr:hypothetical protein [Paenibacillus protaetiae]
MDNMLRNNKGLTLAEVTGTLVLTVMLLGFMLFLVMQAHNGVRDVSGSEAAVQQSQTIVNAIVASARQYGFKPSAAPNSLQFTGSGGESVTYTYNPANRSVTADSRRLDGQGVLQQSSIVFPGQVASFDCNVTGSKIEISLTMLRPNKQIYQTSTTVYSLS